MLLIVCRQKYFWSILQKSNKRWRLLYNPLLKESYYVSINQTFCVSFSPKSYWWGQQSVFPCKKSPKLTQQVHLEAGLHRGGDVVVGGAAAEHTVHIMPDQCRSSSLLPNDCPLFVHFWKVLLEFSQLNFEYLNFEYIGQKKVLIIEVFFREGSSLPWWGLTAGPHSRSWLAPGLGPVCNVNISSDGDNTLHSTAAHLAHIFPHQADYIGSLRIFSLHFCPRDPWTSSPPHNNMRNPFQYEVECNAQKFGINDDSFKWEEDLWTRGGSVMRSSWWRRRRIINNIKINL